jgi:uncharacterized membrane protein
MANGGRAIASIGIALVAFLLGFMLLTAAPVWYFTLRHGSQALENSPAGGGTLVVGAAPIAAAISLIVAIVLGVTFYYRPRKKAKSAPHPIQKDA